MLMDADPAAANPCPHSVNQSIITPDPHEPQETKENAVHKFLLEDYMENSRKNLV
jgi:hypothetical protein